MLANIYILLKDKTKIIVGPAAHLFAIKRLGGMMAHLQDDIHPLLCF
jgi:hypothetical protein